MKKIELKRFNRHVYCVCAFFFSFSIIFISNQKHPFRFHRIEVYRFRFDVNAYSLCQGASKKKICIHFYYTTFISTEMLIAKLTLTCLIIMRAAAKKNKRGINYKQSHSESQVPLRSIMCVSVCTHGFACSRCCSHQSIDHSH